VSSKAIPVIALVVAMLLTGVGTYTYLGAHRSVLRQPPKAPTQVKPLPPAFLLSGTLYLAQSGTLYTLSSGQFRQLTTPGGWMQPQILPAGTNFLAIKRETLYADVYQLAADGSVIAKLTSNAAPSRFSDIGANHWSFYPTLAPDGKSIFMSYDSAKFGDYEVDLGIWQMLVGGTRSQWRQWTFPNSYTGGDVQPVPLASGGLLYVSYDQDADGKKASQIWYKAQRTGKATALTTLDEDCSEPSLSPDGKTLAMVCTDKQQCTHIWSWRTSTAAASAHSGPWSPTASWRSRPGRRTGAASPTWRRRSPISPSSCGGFRKAVTRSLRRLRLRRLRPPRRRALHRAARAARRQVTRRARHQVRPPSR